MKPDRPYGPSPYPATFTLWLGIAAFIPLMAPLAAFIACINATISMFLCSTRPGSYTGKRRVKAGLLLCAAAMVLFFGESTLFLKWKLHQAHTQKVEITKLRMASIADSFEEYRRINGEYPRLAGAMQSKSFLKNKTGMNFTLKDGFGNPLSINSSANNFTIASGKVEPCSNKNKPYRLVVQRSVESAE